MRKMVNNPNDVGDRNDQLISFVGPAGNHNVSCAMCGEQPAVFNCNLGYFDPCWQCQEKKGFKTMFFNKKIPKWLRKFLFNFLTKGSFIQ